MIQNFIYLQFEVSMQELLPALQYIARFFGFESSKVDYPLAIQQNKANVSKNNKL
jgi:hypothetical protein